MIEARESTSNHEIFNALEGEVIACSALAVEPHDVLGANAYFAKFPAIIASRDVASLHQIRDLLAQRTDEKISTGMTSEEARIAQRDLGMWFTAGVLVPGLVEGGAKGYSREGSIPEAREVGAFATDVMVRISRMVGLPPRANDDNYARPDNPRWFTDRTVDIGGTKARAEAVLKVTVGKGIKEQDKTLDNLIILSSVDELQSPEFVSALQSVSADFRMLARLAVFRRNLPLDFFTGELTPLFTPLRVDGRVHLHSGAQFVPMHALDDIFWRLDTNQPAFADYRIRHTSDAPISQKLKLFTIRQHMNTRGATLLTEVLSSIPDPEQAEQQDLEAPAAMYDLWTEIAAFRSGHTRAINQSSGLRGEASAAGTGGSLGIAFALSEESNRVRDLLKPYASEYARRRQELAQI